MSFVSCAKPILRSGSTVFLAVYFHVWLYKLKNRLRRAECSVYSVSKFKLFCETTQQGFPQFATTDVSSTVVGVQYYRVSCCLHAGKMLWSPLALPRKPATQLPNSNERIASPKRTSIFPLLPPAIHHSNLLDECSLSFFARNTVDNMLRTQITSFTMETNLEDHINFTTMSAEHLYYGQLNVHCLPLYFVSRICCLASTEVCCTTYPILWCTSPTSRLQNIGKVLVKLPQSANKLKIPFTKIHLPTARYYKHESLFL